MADKDDEVTPFDDDRWVDRDADDDGAPPWLAEEDEDDVVDSSPAADDPWAESSDDWRDRLVDEAAPETDPLVDRDNEDDARFSAGEREGESSGAAPAASGPGLSDRDDAHSSDRPVDRDDPAGDALNALAERELAALGEDRYPLDAGDGEDSETGDEDTIAGASADDSDADINSDAPAPWPASVDRDDQPARAPLVDSDEDATPFAAAAPPAGRRWP
ncbi:hypothetical protein, partial [Pseudohaliea rubra]|uniref:hypothetical protein n=1 Tax=Pseudohaliea rubra TaxID=475795 RepID=UPI000555266B